MKRILFVDDESRMLEGLERLLYAYTEEWDLLFAEGGQAALDLLENETVDVLVTDMRMPGIDGATLLKRVHELYPRIVRIVLSGHTELEAALRAMPIAHQFLSKPCDPATLMETLDRACKLQEQIGDDLVLGLVSGVVDLPTRPRLFSELSVLLADERTSPETVAALIEEDVATTSKLLQLVNSAYFRPKTRISNVRGAVSLLGTRMLRHLVLSIEVFQASSKAVKGLRVDELNRHAMQVASLAKRLVKNGAGDDAFLAGMLHDVGTLVLATRLPEYFQEVAHAVRERKLPQHEVERELKGVTHAEVGAHLLGLWGMAYPVVEAVADHHATAAQPARGLDVCAAVRIGDLLAHESTEGAGARGLDEAFLREHGVEGDLREWRAWADALAGGGEA